MIHWVGIRYSDLFFGKIPQLFKIPVIKVFVSGFRFSVSVRVLVSKL